MKICELAPVRASRIVSPGPERTRLRMRRNKPSEPRDLKEGVAELSMTKELSRRSTQGSDNSLKNKHIDQSPERSDGTTSLISKFPDTLSQTESSSRASPCNFVRNAAKEKSMEPPAHPRDLIHVPAIRTTANLSGSSRRANNRGYR